LPNNYRNNSPPQKTSNFEKFKYGNITIPKQELNILNVKKNLFIYLLIQNSRLNKHQRIRSEQIPFKINTFLNNNNNYKKENIISSSGNKQQNILSNFSTNPETNLNINPTFNNNSNNNFIFNSPVFKFNDENNEDKYRESNQYYSSDKPQRKSKTKSILFSKFL